MNPRLAVFMLMFAAVESYAVAQTLPAPGPQLPALTASPALGASTATSAAGPNPFSGSTALGTATAETMDLSLPDAIARGLKTNLGLLLREQNVRGTQGEQWQTRSALLPSLTGHTSESEEQINLQSFGFANFPGIPQIVGPFSVFDARGTVSQSLDVSAWSKAAAADAGTQAARFSYQDAREIVVSLVADLYFRAESGAARVDAARSQVQTAEALFRQATDFKNSGIVPAIEALRAQVEFQAQQQRLIYLQNEQEKNLLDLARAIGLPAGQPFRLSDTLSPAAPPAIDLNAARERALAARPDYQSLRALMLQAEREKQGAQEEHLPALTLHGDYGTSGQAPQNSHGTFTAFASLDVPLFVGGRIRGEVLQADALLQQRREQVENLRGRVDYELRTAQLDLQAAAQQVEVASSARDLAGQEMAQAQDRFAAGVVSNIEVVQAQQALATADENYISSLYSLNVAKVALARAMGSAEKNLGTILKGENP